MRKPIALTACVALVAGALAAQAGKPRKPPVAAKRPVTDAYHGVAVTDDYRWLEANDDSEVKAWTQARSEHARAHLEALPATRPIFERLMSIDDARPVAFRPYLVGERWYASKSMPGKNKPSLVRLAAPEDVASAREILDLNTLDPKGLTSIEFMDISLDGTKLALCLSERGSEEGTLSFWDLATGKRLADEIPRVNMGTGGGDVAWLPDSSGVYYTRYPARGERPDADLAFYQQVYLHRLGTPIAKDAYVLGKEFPKIAETAFVTSHDGRRLLVQVAHGDGGEFAFWLLGPRGKFLQVARFEDGVVDARFGLDGALYLLSVKDAPKGRILRLAPGEASLAAARVVVPEGEGSIERYVLTRSRLYVTSLVGGPHQLRAYGLDGSGGERVPAPEVAAITSVQRLDAKTDEILFTVMTHLSPPTVYRWAPGGELARSPLSQTSPIDLSAYEVERVMAPSRDGTQVPLVLLPRKGMKRDGKNPTLLTGYGGYGVSMSPWFMPSIVVWLEQGGVYAIANLRGGGEFGEAWHQAGMLTRKQNVFDDFLGCAEWLVREKVTSPRRLAIEGGSNGGLLMGAALTQRPELFAAVVSSVGIYDMLRTELSANGEYNVTEYGTVKDRAQFEALHAYSPYHRVKDGAKYPPILMITGENDPRVEPMQSRKFAARLEAAGARTVLLLTNAQAGHGVPERGQRLRQEAYEWAFLMDRLGMKLRPVKAR